MNSRKCTFCQNEREIHEVDAPALRLCTGCRDKLNTHIAAICTGCQTLAWIPKTPENVMVAAELSGVPPEYIMDNCVVHQVKQCLRCYDPVSEYLVSGKFLH